MVNIRRHKLENAFLELLDHLQPKPEYIDLFTKIALDIWNQRRARLGHYRANLEKQVNDIQEKKNRLVEAFVFEGMIDKPT